MEHYFWKTRVQQGYYGKIQENRGFFEGVCERWIFVGIKRLKAGLNNVRKKESV